MFRDQTLKGHSFGIRMEYVEWIKRSKNLRIANLWDDAMDYSDYLASNGFIFINHFSTKRESKRDVDNEPDEQSKNPLPATGAQEF